MPYHRLQLAERGTWGGAVGRRCLPSAWSARCAAACDGDRTTPRAPGVHVPPAGHQCPSRQLGNHQRGYQHGYQRCRICSVRTRHQRRACSLKSC